MYKAYNPNPKGRNVGDCVIRAICKATGKTWDTVFAELSVVAYSLNDMPSANQAWGAYLRKLGFKRHIVNDMGRDDYTVSDFCNDHKIGVFVLAIQGHVVTSVNGDYYDTWDSGNECPIYYWSK